MSPQQYCLRWKYHHNNLQTMFSQLLDRGFFTDVTLACGGQIIRAHRVVLCACSSFFDSLLTNYAHERDPIIIMKDVTFSHVQALIEFMYKGETNVDHAHLPSLLKTAEDLKIKGLADIDWREGEETSARSGSVPPMPPAETEFLLPSPTSAAHRNLHDSYGAPQDLRSSPSAMREMLEPRRALSPHQGHHRHQTSHRLPHHGRVLHSPGTPLPASTTDHFHGQKRKRGRPPLDDAYDVFNIRKLPHLSNQLDTQLQHEAQMHQAAYQQHIQMQKRRHRQRYTEQQRHAVDSDEAEELNADPEWINSNLEINVAENGPASHADQRHEREHLQPLLSPKLEVVEDPLAEDTDAEKPPMSEAGNEKQQAKAERHKKRSPLEKIKEHHRLQREKEKQQQQEERDEQAHKLSDQENEQPHITEEREAVSQKSENSKSVTVNGTDMPSTSAQIQLVTSQSKQSMSTMPPPPPQVQSPAVVPSARFNEYPPQESGGYAVNEHGMLVAHDFTPGVGLGGLPPATNGNEGNGGDDAEFDNMRLEELEANDLSLTTAEMTEWQDVIKMDDYLAKGRRPQFWEEKFTKKVLEAINNKRLEMKKAARILGVSYGTLYGRYREVYGCLKHPYSNTTIRITPQQPRFEGIWPGIKREPHPLVNPLEIGKIRAKDMSELWARPQI